MPELRLDAARYHRGQKRSRRFRRWLAGGALALVAGVVIAVVVLATGERSKSAPFKAVPVRSRRAASPRGTTLGKLGSKTKSKATGTRTMAASPAIALPRVLGQLLVGGFTGTVPPDSLLTRIRRGELGGVILYSDNTAGGLSETRSMDAEMQRAARVGGNPPLLIMTDQEGGAVRRLAGAPTMNADEIKSPTEARQEGIATGQLLRFAGINLDLAPVSDVAAADGSFLGPRSFGTDPSSVGVLACAFADGLASTHVGYTLKHFPGLGLATTSTDLAPVTINASAAVLETDWDAYRLCGSNPRALIMISNAIYPELTGPLPAVESPLTYDKALRLAVGRRPVTISDNLEAGAMANQPSPALHAFTAGLDIAMYASTADGSQLAFARLLSEARAGLLAPKRLVAAEKAVLAFKRAIVR